MPTARGLTDITLGAPAMMDSRIIDINFSRPFMRLVLEQEMPMTMASIRVRRLVIRRYR